MSINSNPGESGEVDGHEARTVSFFLCLGQLLAKFEKNVEAHG